MAVQFIIVEGFFFLCEFIGPRNPLMSACMTFFVFLCRSAKNTASKFKDRANNDHKESLPFQSKCPLFQLKLVLCSCLSAPFPRFLRGPLFPLYSPVPTTSTAMPSLANDCILVPWALVIKWSEDDLSPVKSELIALKTPSILSNKPFPSVTHPTLNPFNDITWTQDTVIKKVMERLLSSSTLRMLHKNFSHSLL